MYGTAQQKENITELQVNTGIQINFKNKTENCLGNFRKILYKGECLTNRKYQKGSENRQGK